MKICENCPAHPVCKYFIEDPDCAEVQKLLEALKPSHNNARDAMPLLCVECKHFDIISGRCGYCRVTAPVA